MPALNVEIHLVVARGGTMTTDAFPHSTTFHVDRMRYVLSTINQCTPKTDGDYLLFDIDHISAIVRKDPNLAPLLKENIIMNLRPILESLEIFSFQGTFIRVLRSTLDLELEAWGLSNP